MSEPTKKPIDCGKALGRVWAYLDGELSVEEREEFEVHLARCWKCSRSHDFERRLLDAIRQGDTRSTAETEALTEQIRAAIRRHGSDDDASTARP
ncbi:MAG: anti-sigma factor [Gemmatimonadales bacterium]